ncbi:Transmembrane protein [Trema orientale]|uniref:Transmembrane protein n=1 Tax=Trema orientale TaxID=63057 RepID=A0A2P5BC51_TREOI|nr:Transmembrane protein [Trema orientale]
MLVFTELNLVESRAIRSRAKSKTKGHRRIIGIASVSKSVTDRNGRVLATDRVYNKLASGPSGKGTGH